MQATITTERLLLQPLTANHGHFIQTLVNSPGWIRFIGDRNIKTEQDALAYIEKINANPSITYWVVRIKDGEDIGIISFIQRDFLEHPDIGFAFLPAYTGKGYALEATGAALQAILYQSDYTIILANTLPDNLRSIRLLLKMGFEYDKEVETNGITIQIYKLSR